MSGNGFGDFGFDFEPIGCVVLVWPLLVAGVGLLGLVLFVLEF